LKIIAFPFRLPHSMVVRNKKNFWKLAGVDGATTTSPNAKLKGSSGETFLYRKLLTPRSQLAPFRIHTLTIPNSVNVVGCSLRLRVAASFKHVVSGHALFKLTGRPNVGHGTEWCESETFVKEINWKTVIGTTTTENRRRGIFPVGGARRYFTTTWNFWKRLFY
jgi:hypothetical protein